VDNTSPVTAFAQIEVTVIGRAKDRLAIVPTLRNVVSDARKDDARAAGHT